MKAQAPSENITGGGRINMPPIISVVGRSESGKTILLGKLITEIKRRGYSIAVIKHTHHDFEIDETGKDSWKFANAGGDAVMVSSPRRFAIFKQTGQDLEPQELARYFTGDYDLILTEGFMRSDTLKIEVHRKELDNKLLCPPEKLLAVVTDEPLTADAPQFAKDDVEKIADLIETKVLARREDDVELSINGAPVTIKPFVKDFVARTLVGMVSALKGVNAVKSLNISLKRKG
jgi:molybdopterin-guanine dinucleotide biosynthesis protein B